MPETKLLPWFSFETVYEMDYDGSTGNPMGVLVDGHISDFELECFMAREMEDEYYDAPYKGFDVQYIWWSTAPYVDDEGEKIDGSYIYVYSDVEREGWKPSTRIEENTTWDHWCVNHPDEAAVIGMPLSEFVEEDHHRSADGKSIHYCRPCLRAFEERRKAERKRIMDLPENRSE